MNENYPDIFTVEDAKYFLSHYRAPLKALSLMVEKGELIRLKRGLYAKKEGFDPLKVAYLLRSPSYISYETALNYYGLIPEKVEQITSVVDGRAGSFLAGSVIYSYSSQNRKLYSLGMSLEFIGDHPMPIACREKAVLDTLAKAKLVTANLTDKDIFDYLSGSLRIDVDTLLVLSLSKLEAMAPLYRNMAPRKFVNELAKRKKGSNHE